MKNLLLPLLFLFVNSLFIVCCNESPQELYIPNMDFVISQKADGTFEAIGKYKESYQNYQTPKSYSMTAYPVYVPGYLDIRGGDTVSLSRDQSFDEFFTCSWGDSQSKTFVQGRLIAQPKVSEDNL